MKKGFTILLLLVSAATIQATTWYTTGEGSDWTDANSWSTHPELTEQRGVPSFSDEVVIRHPLTMTLAEQVIFRGNISIVEEGILEIFSFRPAVTFSFEGHLLSNDGILMTNIPLQMPDLQQLGYRTIALGEGSQTLLGSDLILAGKSRLELANASCGATLITGSIMVHGSDAELIGTGNMVAEGGFRIWNDQGEEIIDATTRQHVFTSQMASEMKLYLDVQACAAGHRGMIGSMVPSNDQAETESMAIRPMSLFPNPSNANSPIHIESEGFTSETTVVLEIRTLMGQQVLSHRIRTSSKGKVEEKGAWDLQPGQYFVTIRDNSHLSIQRLVCQ